MASDLAVIDAPHANQEALMYRGVNWYTYPVGDIEIAVLNDGTLPMPVEGFVRDIPLAEVQRALADAFLPTDVFTNSFNLLLLKVGDRKVLIDTGFGERGSTGTGLAYRRGLAAIGIAPADIDTVVISHFHTDHILGLRTQSGEPSFARAQILVPEVEQAFWADDGAMSRAPAEMKDLFKSVRDIFSGWDDRIATYGEGTELVAGLHAIATPGHTPGHMSFRLESGKDQLLILSDVTNNPVLFARHPEWPLVFDMDPATALESRRRLLSLAAADRLPIAGYHYPFPSHGHITRDGTGYRFVPAEWRANASLP
jgi:glyoxylase-like metal-dependent hydrolase (beta-lactamase superfamily II)